MMNRLSAKLLGAAVLFCLLLLPRLPGLALAVSPDEPKWLTRSGNFYHALAHQNWAGTYQVEHPGVAVMYVGMTTFLAQYPSFGTQAPAPFDWDRGTMEQWIIDQTPLTPLQLLVGARWATILLATALLLLAYLPLRRVLTPSAGLLALLFVGWSPLGLALSQRLHPDGLMSLFLFLGLVAFLAWLYAGRRLPYLLLSAAATALAGLTKTPAIFLVLTAAALTAIEWLRSDHRARSSLARGLLLWAAVGAALFFALWPAMWVQPLQTLGQVLAGMGVHAEGHSNPNFFWGEIREDPGWLFYPVALWFRTTPASAIGLALALGLMALPNPSFLRRRPERQTLLAVLLFALLFVLGISLGGKKSDRYLLPVLLAVDLVGAAGWFALAQLASQRLPLPTLRVRPGVPAALLLSALPLVVLHGAPALYHAPYYFTYFNPLAGGTEAAPEMLVVGWGEGLDQAGLWLNEYDQGQGRTASAAYSLGSVSYFYKHPVISFSDESRRAWLESDYAVTYLNQKQRLLPDPALHAFFAAQTPVYTYSFRGLKLVEVYDLLDTLPPPSSGINARRIVDFGGSLRLLDHEIRPETPQPGQSGEVALYLKKIGPRPHNASVLLRLTGADGQEVWRSEGWPYGQPTSTWPLRSVLRDAHLFTLPTALPAGLYLLSLSFYDNTTLAMLPVTYPGNAGLAAGEESARLALLQIGDPPPAPRRAGWEFGSLARLADATLPSTAGQQLEFELLWESLQPTDEHYTVFVHLLDAAGQIVAQQDREPQQGFAPLRLWQPGLVIRDRYQIELPAGLPPQLLTVRVGLYDSSGVRLLLADGADTALLGTVQIHQELLSAPLPPSSQP